jgi:hypothetical protein
MQTVGLTGISLGGSFAVGLDAACRLRLVSGCGECICFDLILNRPANGSATQALISLSSPYTEDHIMPTQEDAKAMAKSLRVAMAGRNIALSHSECLEIVARQHGFADWNTLTAKLSPTASHEPVFCSFCDKPKQEVRALVEGGCRSRYKRSSCVFICDECVAFCAEVFADRAGEGVPVR